jgi:hypothetical protein
VVDVCTHIVDTTNRRDGGREDDKGTDQIDHVFPSGDERGDRIIRHSV